MTISKQKFASFQASIGQISKIRRLAHLRRLKDFGLKIWNKPGGNT
jgi:hypothetical protein